MKKEASDLIFKTPDINDTEALFDLEHICFPPNEASGREAMEKRLCVMPEVWLSAVDKETGRTAGFISGYSSSEERLCDEMFKDVELFERDGKNVMILSVGVHPDYRGRGISSQLIIEYKKRMKSIGKESLVLTCHDYLITFYEKFGFKDLGLSKSELGGEIWYDMACKL